MKIYRIKHKIKSRKIKKKFDNMTEKEKEELTEQLVKYLYGEDRKTRIKHT